MRNKKKRILIAVVIFVLSVVSATTVYILLSGSQGSKTALDVETTSREPSAQSDFSQGGEREVVMSEKTEGYVTDTNGQIPTTLDEGSQISSSGGIITVYTPSNNTLLSNGSTIAGAASVDRVAFRLIDDVSGVISQGSLLVVNGKFSGTFSFGTSGTGGRLDLFTVDTSGIESNVLEIPVRFK